MSKRGRCHENWGNGTFYEMEKLLRENRKKKPFKKRIKAVSIVLKF